MLRTMLAASLPCLCFVAVLAGNRQTPASSEPVTLYASVTDKAGAFVLYGPTPLWDTLRSSFDVLAKESGYRAVVVLSDGQDSSSKVKYSAVADFAQTSRIVVHAIETPWSAPLINGKPAGYRNDDLQGIVRDAGGLHRRVPKVDDRTAIDDLNHALRERYQITFTPKSADGKLHSVDLRTTRSDLTVRVARKYARQ